MTSSARPGTRILGCLRSADGKGIVRIEDRYDTDIDDLWSASPIPRAWPAGTGRLKAISAPAESSASTSRPMTSRPPGAWKRASPRGGCW